MSCVIDLCPWRFAPQSVLHPAGVSLPFKDAGDVEFLIPQLRQAISSGNYCADMIRAFPSAVRPGDRILVVGSGIGILSTLVAKVPGVEKVVAMESDIRVAAYIDEVHRQNGVPWVETVNAIPSDGRQGRVPLFVRHDVRCSSLVPDDGPWRQVMLIPGVDLGLIVAEERIGLIVADRAVVSAKVPEKAQLGSTVRVLLGFPEASEASCEGNGLAATLAVRAGAVERFGATLLFGQGAGTAADRAHRAGALAAQ